MKRPDAIRQLSQHRLSELSSLEREGIILNWFAIDEDDDEFALLNPELQAELLANDDPPSDTDHPRFDDLVMVGLADEYEGVTSSYLADALGGILNEQPPTIVGESRQLEACPVCAFRTLDERGHYDICKVCGWEDAGDTDLNTYSGPNRMTLAEGRANFAATGVADSRMADKLEPDRQQRYVRAV